MHHLIETQRLILEELKEIDYAFIVAIEQTPENKIYEMEGVLEQDKILENCKEFADERDNLPDGGAIKFIVKLKDQTPIGFVSLVCNWEKTREWELGYALLPKYQHQGYAFESIHAAIRYGFETFNIHKLMAFVNANNLPSIKVLEKLDMKLEGHMREARLIQGVWADEKVFSLLKTDLG